MTKSHEVRSSDGSTIITEAEDRVIRLFDCPPAAEIESSDDPQEVLPEEWTSRKEITAADAVLSTCWFPHSRSDDPARYCFATAVKDHPIHLLDATDGRLRASYPLVDHREQMVAPHSMLFSQDGTSLYASHECAIEIFDISRPGCPGERYKTSPTRRSRDGQKGIISTLAADPTHTGLLAAGSFSGQIGIYDTLASELSPQMIFHSAEHTGITQVKFHLLNERVLFTASRRSNSIECWDLRYAAACFHTFHRPGHTNQRLSFDIDYSGFNLATGAQDGKIRVYRLDHLDSEPVLKMTLHSDVIGSVAFSPAGCSIVSCSGSRKNKFDEAQHINEIDVDHDLYGGPPERKNDTELAIWKFNYV
ncbi:WD40-repeat-containing domain protein [Melampsora americana]|nr:WD40-repeat-containing domain protein [Melampsora americana]